MADPTRVKKFWPGPITKGYTIIEKSSQISTEILYLVLFSEFGIL